MSKKELKNKIIYLKSKGLKHREIIKILGCSSRMISYHTCSEEIKNKNSIESKIRTFHLNETEKKSEFHFTYNDVLIKFGSKPKCAISGRDLSWESPSDFHFDHIIPKSKKINNSLNNLQLLCKKVNIMKKDIPNKDFINYCKLIYLRGMT